MPVSDLKEKVKSYLKKANYRYVKLCLTDIMQVLDYIGQSSKVKMDKFYFENEKYEKSRDLIVIKGIFASGTDSASTTR
jgi:hypothetical protein